MASITNEADSKVGMIVQHIMKNKKLVLPKAYVRNPKAYQAEYADMEDELIQEETLVSQIPKTEVAETSNSVFEPKPEVVKERVKIERKKVKAEKTETAGDKKADKDKKPSAYNIFVKETVKKLQDTHQHLGSKERFKLAIQMWSEHKNKTSKPKTEDVTV